MIPSIFQSGSESIGHLSRFTFRLLGLVGRVRPDERRDVAGALLVLFGFMTGHALLETARDALFLAALPARQLPWMYLIIAVGALGLARSETRISAVASGPRPMRWWLAGAGVVTVGFWLVLGGRWDGVYHALYIWSGILATMVVVRFWTLLGSLFTLTQAKRIFPVIASGSVAGAIVGSALARGMTALVPARHLVLLAGVVFLVTSLAPMRAGDAQSPTGNAPAAADGGFGPIARLVWSGSYLRRVAALVLLAAVTFTLVDFTFKSAADRLVRPQDLGAFFASVYLTINILSLVVQVFVVGWLLRHLGLAHVVATVPAVLVVTTLGFAVGGTLALALVLKGSDGTLRHSLHRTGAELLFVPLSHRLRTRVKGFIDVIGQRGGQAAASILILMVLSATGRENVFAGLACLAAVAWLLVAVSLKEHYLDLFRESLYGEAGGDERIDPTLNVASLGALTAALSSADDREVIAALEVLEHGGKVAAVPDLLLYHPSPRVVVHALDAFTLANRVDVAPMLERLMTTEETTVREAAVRAIGVLAPDRRILEAAAEDHSSSVALTARAMLLSNGWLEPAEGVRLFERALREESDAVVASLARALRLRAHPATEKVVRVLMEHDDPEIVSDAMLAARALRTPDLIPPLVQSLRRRAVREEARRALAAYGSVGLPHLLEALRDSRLPSSVRRHIPGALALMGAPQIPTLLLRHLQEETDGMIRFKVLRALGRWRREQPTLPLDADLLQQALGQALAAGFRLMEWRRALEQAGSSEPQLVTEVHTVLVALLRDKQDHALERIFRLLNLQAGTEEFHRIYLGVHSASPSVRAGSRELLQHMILPPVRRSLMTLIDDLHGELQGAAEVSSSAREARRLYAEVLSEVVDCGMESASSLAALQAADLGLSAVLPALRKAIPLSSEHGSSLVRATRRLE